METDDLSMIKLIQVAENGSVGFPERVAAVGELRRLNASSDVVDNISNRILDEWVISQELDAVDPPYQVALRFIYTLTAVLSITGNIVVIIVLTFGKRSSTELRAFLVNLAVADITMAIFSIPFTYTIYMWGQWIFLPAFCPVALVMQHVSVIVSVYTLTVIGFDRYKAILHPFERRLTKSRTKLVMFIIWLTAFSISSIQLVVSRATPFKHKGQTYLDCSEKWAQPWHGKVYTVFIFVVTFFVPLLGISVAYCAIAHRIFQHNAPGNADPDRDLVQLRAKRKVIKMLVTIVALFAICWLPLQLYVLLFFFIPGFGTYHTNYGRHIYALAYFGCHWLANANSFVNPLVYCFMSDNFRADLREILKLAPPTRCRNFESLPVDAGPLSRSASTRGTIIHRGECFELNGNRRGESCGGTTRLISASLSTTPPTCQQTVDTLDSELTEIMLTDCELRTTSRRGTSTFI